ncbi:MAG: UV DNA damage repair endonuclease UvsE [Candidatus Nitrosopolaris sp.]
MKIGYPCINRSLVRSETSTFRLASYSEDRLIKTINNNLVHLSKILNYNVENHLLFFRISSDLIPFASHPICKYNWLTHFKSEFKEIGDYIIKNNIRISMHPDQFVLINSPHEKVTQNSIRELQYHCDILDAMCLDRSAKIQIHVGGAYGEKTNAINTFIRRYHTFLSESIKGRLVIENDDHLFNLNDCMIIHQETSIPIVFDNFHHDCFSDGESLDDSIKKSNSTWKKAKDGPAIMDYSSQQLGERKGKHANTTDISLFEKFVLTLKDFDADIMLEIKDKEKSALKAFEILRHTLLKLKVNTFDRC